MPEPLIAITIARQLGAGGAPLGKRLAQRLNFTYLDDEILRMAAEKSGAKPEELARWDEHRSRFWERLASTFSLGAPEGVFQPVSGVAVVQDKEVFELQSEVIQETAGKDNCVIIGRAGFWILRDHPGRISVFLHAPVECRIPAIMEAFKVDAAKARQLIERIDVDRTRFVAETTGREITAVSQHICADTSKVPLAALEELIVAVVNHRRTMKTPCD